MSAPCRLMPSSGITTAWTTSSSPSSFRTSPCGPPSGQRRTAFRFRRFKFHDLRHYHAVLFLKDGRDIYDLQKRLGHSSIKVTEQYLTYLTAEEKRICKFGKAAGVRG
jgi:integrase